MINSLLLLMALCATFSVFSHDKKPLPRDEYFEEVTYYKRIKRVPPVEFYKKTIHIKKKRSVRKK